MSTVNEIIGNGATVEYSTNLTTPSWTPFGMLADVGEEKWSAAEIKNTNLASVAHTSQPGIPDYGEESWTIRYQKELVSVIKGFMDNRQIVLIRVTIPDTTATATPAEAASTAQFKGWVKEFSPFTDLTEDGLVDAKLTIRITGPVTFTAGV